MQIKDWKILSFFSVLFICSVFFYCLDGILGTNTVKIPELMAQMSKSFFRNYGSISYHQSSFAALQSQHQHTSTGYSPSPPEPKYSITLPYEASPYSVGFQSVSGIELPKQHRIALQDFIRGSAPIYPFLSSVGMPITDQLVTSNGSYGTPVSLTYPNIQRLTNQSYVSGVSTTLMPQNLTYYDNHIKSPVQLIYPFVGTRTFTGWMGVSPGIYVPVTLPPFTIPKFPELYSTNFPFLRWSNGLL